MTANYLHGIETTEVERGPRPIRVVKSAVIALVGTAPIGPINQLTLCLNDTDAIQFGSHTTGFSIPEALDGIYDFGAGTVLVVNVLDPAIHNTSVTDQPKQFADNNQLQLDHSGLQRLQLTPADGTEWQALAHTASPTPTSTSMAPASLASVKRST